MAKKRVWAIEITDKEGPLVYLVALTDAEADGIIGILSRYRETGKIMDYRGSPAEKVGMNVKSFRRKVLGLDF